MIKIETHCHQKGTSACADTDKSIIIEKYLNAGYKGIVSTNHIDIKNIAFLKGESQKEKMDSFFKVYDDFKEYAEKRGVKVLFGAEIRLNPVGEEFAVYGLPRRVFYDEKPLYEFNQEELFRLTEREHAFMFQTHPFRTGVKIGNPCFMHGAESFNGHYHHENNNDLAKKFCEENNLIKMSGTDFHHAEQPITAGIFVPESIKDEQALVDYIFKDNFNRIENADEYKSSRLSYLEHRSLRCK